MAQDQGFQQRVDRIGDLVEQLERAADPAVRAASRELVAAVMELHAVGLERVLEIVSRSGAGAAGILESFTRDPLIGSLLILHGAHPDDLETRVRKALEGVHGVTLLSIEGGAVRLAARNGGEAAAREVLAAAAPDLTEIVIEGASAGFVPLETLRAAVPESNS